MQKLIAIIFFLWMCAVCAYPQSCDVRGCLTSAYTAFLNGDEEAVKSNLSNVKEEEIISLPDTLQYTFYYCNAGLMSMDDNADKIKYLDYIEKALKLREKSLGIRHSEYLELLWAKGTELEDSNADAATKAYQRGIVIGQGIVNRGNDAVDHWFGRLLSATGALYQKRGYISQAISLYREGFSLTSNGYKKDETPDAWIGLFSLQLMYYNQQNYQEAIKVNDELLAFFNERGANPSHDYADVLYFKGNCLINNGQIDDAIKCYTAGIEMLKGFDDYDKQLESLYSNLYIAYVSHGRLSDAENLMTVATDFFNHHGTPDNICNYYYSGAQALLDSEKYAEAENLALKCEAYLGKMNPANQVSVLNTIGVSRLKQGNGASALEPLKRINYICQQNDAIETDVYAINLHNLGRAYMLMGDSAKAIELLKESHNLQLRLNGKVIETTTKYLTELGEID